MDLSFLPQLESAVLCHFPKGHCLIQQEDPPKYIYYLIKGSCERIEYSDYGDEISFNTKMSDSGLSAIVGLNNLWNPQPASFSTFIAETDLTCYRIDAAIAKKAFQQDPEILDSIITMQAENYIRLRALFKCHHERRIPNLLCALLCKNAVATPDGLLIPKKLSNVSISRQIGVHQVTVAKIMTYLQKEAILLRTPDGIKITDPAQLDAYAANKKMDYLAPENPPAL